MLENPRKAVEENQAVAAGAVVLVAALAVGFLVQGFGASSGDAVYEQQELRKTTAAASALSLDAGSGGAAESRKKITTVDLNLEVPDVEKAQQKTRQLVEQYNGTVSSVSIRREDGQTGSMTVRVPADDVSSFINRIEQNWRVQSLYRDTRDVTDRYTELSLELKNKRQELNQLEQMMNRTTDVDSLIKIQERMSELRSRIQFLQNQLSDLERRVEYTEIRIDYEEPQPITAEFELRESLRNGYQGVFRSLNLMIVGLGYLAPFIAAIAAFVYGRRFLEKRRQ